MLKVLQNDFGHAVLSFLVGQKGIRRSVYSTDFQSLAIHTQRVFSTVQDRDGWRNLVVDCTQVRSSSG